MAEVIANSLMIAVEKAKKTEMHSQ
jgi:hypothetical protein